MSDAWKDEHIEWYADDLYNLGYLFNETEWERFSTAMNDCAMEFFLQMQIDDEFIASLGDDELR
jgi:hypothetical protein